MLLVSQDQGSLWGASVHWSPKVIISFPSSFILPIPSCSNLNAQHLGQRSWVPVLCSSWMPLGVFECHFALTFPGFVIHRVVWVWRAPHMVFVGLTSLAAWQDTQREDRQSQCQLPAPSFYMSAGKESNRKIVTVCRGWKPVWPYVSLSREVSGGSLWSFVSQCAFH